MSKPDVWMPLVIGDYLADTAHLSTAEHGAYLLLLMTAWMREGTLPDDDAQLARITRASNREWRTLRASLAPFFHVADGVWRQKRLTAELEKAKAFAVAAGAKASKAAGTRWGKVPEECLTDAPSIAQALPKQSPSPVPVPSSLRSEKKRPPPEVSIPEDFAISERVAAWAERKGYSTRILADALEIFIGRNKASAKRYADWDQAFMNAVREDWYGLRKPAVKTAIAPFDVDSQAHKLGLSARPGESMEQFVMRVRQTREVA